MKDIMLALNSADLFLDCLVKSGKDFDDKVYPKGEDLSKEEDGGWVQHYARKKKYGVPVGETGKPPASQKQAIAIGLSVEERGGPKNKKGEKEEAWSEEKWDKVKEKRKKGQEVSSSGRKVKKSNYRGELVFIQKSDLSVTNNGE